jgi:hypothetical protein
LALQILGAAAPSDLGKLFSVHVTRARTRVAQNAASEYHERVDCLSPRATRATFGISQ